MQSHKQEYFVELGKAIRAERQRLSLTQTQLAEFAGCGLTFVNQLERGKPSVRLEKLFTVLEVLGLSLTLSKGKELLVIKKP